MANPLHELAELAHVFGDKMKAIADQMEDVFKRDAPPVEAEIKTDAEAVVDTAAKAAEAAAPTLIADAAKDL